MTGGDRIRDDVAAVVLAQLEHPRGDLLALAVAAALGGVDPHDHELAAVEEAAVNARRGPLVSR